MLNSKLNCRILCLYMVAVFCGCHSLNRPLEGYYYNGKLSPPFKADLASVTHYANRLVNEAGLEVAHKSNSGILLGSSYHSSDDFTVAIACNTQDNVMYISIRGNIESDAAKAANQKVISIFQKEFPNSKLDPVTVYPGWLGP